MAWANLISLNTRSQNVTNYFILPFVRQNSRAPTTTSNFHAPMVEYMNAITGLISKYMMHKKVQRSNLCDKQGGGSSNT